jgi:hypothetical protein
MNPPLEFMNFLFGDLPGSLYFELTFILPPELNPRKRAPITHSYHLGHERPDWDEIARLNNDGWGTYYSLTPKHRRTEKRAHENDTALIQVLWVDIDQEDKDAARQQVYNVHVPPSVLIDSGGGLHALWAIYPVPVDDTNHAYVKRILRGLALATQGDTACAETARVFRLPGTRNTKPKRHNALCQIVDFLPGVTTLADFEDYASLVKPAEREIERQLPRIKPQDTPRYINDYLDTTHIEGTRNASLNAAAYYMYSNGYGEGEAVVMLRGRALDDGLTEHEIAATIHSAYQSTPGQPSYLNPTSKRRMIAGDSLRRRIKED